MDKLFTSSTGRVARAPFIGAVAVLIALAWAYGRWAAPVAAWPVGMVVNALLLFSAACLLSKRLHDRGRAGWWAALVLLAWIRLWPKPAYPIDWAFAPVMAWAVVDLALLPGRAGFNRFGPSPRAAKA